MKYTLEKIYPETAFRLYFFIVLVTAGIAGLLFLIISLFIDMLLLGILIFTVGVPLLALITGSMAALYTCLYSVFAEKFGGVEVNFKKNET